MAVYERSECRHLKPFIIIVCVQPQCQAAQDVEKALSLFENTGRIPATVMEARYLVSFMTDLTY